VGLVIYVWVGFFVFACISSCIWTTAKRRYAEKGEIKNAYKVVSV